MTWFFIGVFAKKVENREPRPKIFRSLFRSQPRYSSIVMHLRVWEIIFLHQNSSRKTKTACFRVSLLYFKLEEVLKLAHGKKTSVKISVLGLFQILREVFLTERVV